MVILVVKRSNDAVFCPACYGSDIELWNICPEKVLDENHPGYEAFIESKVVNCGGINDYPFYHPENIPTLFPNGFDASVAFTVPTFGAAFIYGYHHFEIDPLTENFLLTVGEICSLFLSHCDNGARFDVDKHVTEPVALLPLTPRQWAIKEAMLRGLTNAAIAKEMNFSESLIRHETIRIYSKLGINGRKDLFRLEGESLDQAQ
ncbi:MAG: helix-turn-helix transcriptional regulator [Actinomycetota bacterium]